MSAEGGRGAEPTALHPLLESAFDALNLAGVSWCLLRLPSNLAAPTGDVDLLVDRAQEGRVRSIFGSLGLGRVPVWGRPDPEAFYLLYHAPTDRSICLHVSTEVSFGPGQAARTGAAKECLRRRRRRGAFYEPDPHDAFWILLLHCLLDKGEVAPRYQARLQALAGAARAEGELAGEAETLLPTGCDAPKMLELVRRGDWAALERASGGSAKGSAAGRALDRALRAAAILFGMASSRAVRRYALVKARSLTSPSARAGGSKPPADAGGRNRAGRTRALAGARRLLRSARPGRRRGLTVAVLGPDGVGKTTLAAGLADSFPDFAGVRRLYMGLGYAGLPRLARLPVPGSLAAVGLLTLWWRSLVARYHRGRGRIVIFDRYTYDALLPPGRRLTGPQRLARWVWAHACPAPDLVLLLNAPGRVLYERRGEKDPALMEGARQGYLSLQGRVRGLEVVDASRPEGAVHADVAERIRRRAARRGGTGA